MAFNPSGAKEITLNIMGGMVTEMTAPDVPEGVSPDCQDVEFIPGIVSSRRGCKKVFATPFPSGGPGPLVPTLVYGKSYVSPNQTTPGPIYNLYLDSNGVLWYEDVISNPGVHVAISGGTVTPGAYAKSITAFGREYLAISDGLYGSDVPLQWDGTNLDRVTQDGPGTPPGVASVSIPPVAQAAIGARPVLTVTSCIPAGPFCFQIWCVAGVSGVNQGDQFTIAGSSVAYYNTIWTADTVYPGANLILVMTAVPGGTASGAGGTLTLTPSISMLRQSNIVTVWTAAAHGLRVGYQAQIAGVTAATVGTSISSIIINNKDLPGVATVTTTAAHGLIPGLFVSIQGVAAVGTGGAIVSVTRAGNIVTAVMTTAHNLSPGAIVTLAGVTAASFNTTVPVLNVLSTTVFTFAQVDSDGASSGGTVSINWPIPTSPTPSYFEVIAAPSATAFQVAVNYSDSPSAGWTTGTVSYAWNGTFYVTSVPSATSFQYQQYGPDASVDAHLTGTVTPWGQAAPGRHQLQVHFLTRQGYITRPSPPVSFTASGGQYISVSNIPIGPSNVVARILAFTGASGAYFYFIPVVPQVNGQVVGTATQINDNTTTDILLDFADNTLFAALGVSFPGNNLSNQIIIDGALGFALYASRLITWGQRNCLQNLLNMGFEGGALPTTPTLPTGWQVTGTAGVLGTGNHGAGFSYTGAGSIWQSFYQDCYGAPIATALVKYTLRAWVKGAGKSITATISAASTGFSSTATVNGSAAGLYGQTAFSLAMPATIPADMILSITGSAVGVICDELAIMYHDAPYLDRVLYASYTNNPEAFDGVTGKLGSSQDARKVMDLSAIRQTLCILTQDPGGRLHETQDNGVTEPAGWTINQVAVNCGLLSAFGLTKSQGDDATASGGEEWFAWASSGGARIFGGDQPYKISQEIQPDWNAIVPAYQGTIWALNDPVDRLLYFGLPFAATAQGSPNKIYTCSYRGLDTASQIAAGAPVHNSLAGKLIATDHARKWTRWNLPMNGAALLYHAAGSSSITLLGGNGYPPGAIVGFGNAYTLSATTLTDDDYGLIVPYYTTYFFPSHEQEQQLGLGAGRKMVAYVALFANGTGELVMTPLCDVPTNPWPLTGVRTLRLLPTFDMEWSGANAQSQRIALKIASRPVGVAVTDNAFTLQKVVMWLKIARVPIRGSAT